ncbi:ParB N-terminal domain-containing protein [Streptomyces sp. TLI_171]|uniref:ParB/RepB/Spo0J family partition protein n=1 Tax=Streptomyces sp. TLI_171 TaxID=1938859 RepID=UPI000C55C6A7|nr:ParB N-terminal domain-containing protein [Streptomyces sp. TLI_171]RKE03017.1 ParB family chromosome partitioning protein [Streptomyces sp. TLI_171]
MTTSDPDSDVVPGSAGVSMIHLAEILQRHSRLAQRRFVMLPLRGPGSAYTEPQGRQPGDATAPVELADLISSISEVGLLEPVLVEETPGRGGGAPAMRLVSGERRLRAMRWGALHLGENPHFEAIPAIVCPGPLSDEERATWRFVENFAREDLRPAEQAVALMYQRCAVLVGKLLRAGKPVPREVYEITDAVERFQALEKIRGGDRSCAAPWSEVLTRLGLQLSERKAMELVRAFRELPRDLSEEMDESGIRLNTRIRYAQLQRGRADAAAGIWASLKNTGRLHLLPSAVDIGLAAPDLDNDAIVDAAGERFDNANAGRRAKLSRVPAGDGANGQQGDSPEPGSVVSGAPQPPSHAAGTPPAIQRPEVELSADQRPDTPTEQRPLVDQAVVRTTLDSLRALLADLHTGHDLGRYDRGSLRLALRELEPFLSADTATPASQEVAA